MIHELSSHQPNPGICRAADSNLPSLCNSIKLILMRSHNLMSVCRRGAAGRDTASRAQGGKTNHSARTRMELQQFDVIRETIRENRWGCSGPGARGEGQLLKGVTGSCHQPAMGTRGGKATFCPSLWVMLGVFAVSWCSQEGLGTHRWVFLGLPAAAGAGAGPVAPSRAGRSSSCGFWV